MVNPIFSNLGSALRLFDTQGPTTPDYTASVIPQSMQSNAGMYRNPAEKRAAKYTPPPTRKPLASPMPRPGAAGLAVALALLAESMHRGAGAAGLGGFVAGNQDRAQLQNQQNESNFQNDVQTWESGQKKADLEFNADMMTLGDARAAQQKNEQDVIRALAFANTQKKDILDFAQSVSQTGFKNLNALRMFRALAPKAGIDIESIPELRSTLDSEEARFVKEDADKKDRQDRLDKFNEAKPLITGALAMLRTGNSWQQAEATRQIAQYKLAHGDLMDTLGESPVSIAAGMQAAKPGLDRLQRMEALDEKGKQFDVAHKELVNKIAGVTYKYADKNARAAYDNLVAGVNEKNAQAARYRAQAAKDVAEAKDPVAAARRKMMTDTSYATKLIDAKAKVSEVREQGANADKLAKYWAGELARRQANPGNTPKNVRHSEWVQEAQFQKTTYESMAANSRARLFELENSVRSFDEFAKESWGQAPPAGAPPQGAYGQQNQQQSTQGGNRILGSKVK